MTSPSADRSDLPMDSDIEVDGGQSSGLHEQGGPGVIVPVYLQPTNVALVFAGGAIGTAARFAIAETFPELASLPTAIFAINVVGAFLLGMLLDSLARRGADQGIRRRLRLLLGTGVLGGFTTYSTLAVGTFLLFDTGEPVLAVGYGLATVVIGALATLAGIALGSTMHDRRSGAGS